MRHIEPSETARVVYHHWLTTGRAIRVKQAARLLGVSDATARRRLRNDPIIVERFRSGGGTGAPPYSEFQPSLLFVRKRLVALESRDVATESGPLEVGEADPCYTCLGRGTIRVGLGHPTCSSCKGTGRERSMLPVLEPVEQEGEA